AARLLEAGKNLRPILPRGEQGIEFRAVLERRIHSLAMEGNDRVRGIAEQQYLAAEVPGRGVHRAELSLRVGRKLCGEIRQQRNRVGKLPCEERLHRLRAVERREAPWSVTREEQRRRETAVGVRQCNQHEAAAWPDVQRLALERTRAAGRDGELLVVMVE